LSQKQQEGHSSVVVGAVTNILKTQKKWGWRATRRLLCSKKKHAKNGLVGATTEKRGEKGTILLCAFKDLCGAFESFVKMSAQEGKNDSRRPVLIKWVNACMNHPAREIRRGKTLFLLIQDAVAATLDLGKPDKIEQRRAKWTTWSNVNIWFDSLTDFFTS
jgi:hypothetical protein